ncbi:MAG: Spi family protease inhibitor, partial [Bacteroidales bacterium]|nr:Spi family protease inhibitor [Bacteroidales bacterium]
MRKLFATIVAVFGISYTASAQYVTPETAAAVGGHFLSQQTAAHRQKNSLPTLRLVHTATAPSLQKSGGEVACYHVFNAENGGFVIVAASENIVPILAYSDKGTFDTSDLPINMKALLAAMQEEISDAIRREIPAAPSVMDKWQLLASGGVTIMANENATTVAPLTQNMDWDQWPYFNDSCPKDAGVGSSYGGRCPAGC